MKNLIITGAAGQIGQVFTEFLSNLKIFRVFALDKKFPYKNILNNVEYVELDITKEEEVLNFFSSLDSVEVLINNAGIGVFTPFEERTVEDFMNVVDVNMKGTFLMCRE